MTALPPVMILAGGQATRLGAVLFDRPKILAPVDGVPFLDILLSRLIRQGFTRAHFCLGVMAEQVIDYLARADLADLKVSASIEPRPLGTGGAVLNALPRLFGQSFFVVNGDSLIDFNAGRMAAHHVQSQDGPGVTMLTTHVEDASRFGVVESEDGRVSGFGEKSAAGPARINAGLYLFDRAIFDEDWPIGSEVSLERDMLPNWAAAGQVIEFAVDAPLLDIGTPEALAEATAFLDKGAG